MLEKISEDIKNAMKAKEKEKLDALRYLKSMLLENRTAKSPQPELDIVINLCKKLKDSIDTYPAEHEARGKIQKEIQFLSEYMPKSITEAEVCSIIKEIILHLENPNLGAVMKELSPQIKGRFDGKLANQMVKDALGAS